MVTKIYHRSTLEPFIYIACKSKEASELLDYFALPNMHLNELNVNHTDIDTGCHPCQFHDQLKKFKCSFNVVRDLKNFISNYQ